MLIKDIAEKYSDYVINMRRMFHRHPEIAFEEKETSKMIVKELESMGLSPEVIGKTGVIVDIGDRSKSQKTVLIRSDIDALKVTEETGAEYASENEGYMHACGHDAHIAMNLGCARILSEIQDQLNGTVRLLFQPAEETAGGSSQMISGGVMDGVDTVYGTHVWGDIPAGKFSAEAGPRMAAADFFKITVTGKGTHGSLPHNGIDPIAAAAAIINNLQVAVNREIIATEPVIISFCQIHGGNTDNAIPDTVTIGGTTRTFSNEIRDMLPDLIRRVITETAGAFRAEARLEYNGVGSSPVINDPACSARAINAITKNFGENALTDFGPVMSGEDFSDYQKIVPGVFVFLGVRNEKCNAVYPNHSSHFAMDESVLIMGSTAAVQYAVDFLNS